MSREVIKEFDRMHSPVPSPPDQMLPLVIRMSEQAARLLEQAVAALQGLDPTLAEGVVHRAARLPAEQLCLESVVADCAATAPSDRLLDLIDAAREFALAGHGAAGIARRVSALAKLPSAEMPEDLRVLANSVLAMVQELRRGLAEGGDLRSLRDVDEIVPDLCQQIEHDARVQMENNPAHAAAALLHILTARELGWIARRCAQAARMLAPPEQDLQAA